MASEFQFADNLFALEKLAEAQVMDKENQDRIQSWVETLKKYDKRLEEKLRQAAGKNILPVDLTSKEEQEQVLGIIQEMEEYAEKKQNCRKKEDTVPGIAPVQDKPCLSEIIFFASRRLLMTMQILKSLEQQII